MRTNRTNALIERALTRPRKLTLPASGHADNLLHRAAENIKNPACAAGMEQGYRSFPRGQVCSIERSRRGVFCGKKAVRRWSDSANQKLV